jgi:hypothetical protein
VKRKNSFFYLKIGLRILTTIFKDKLEEVCWLSKRDTMTIVSEMLGLYFGYVIEAATYFRNYQEAFDWLYLSGDNPHQTLNQEELLNKMASISMEEMQEVHANTLLEYMVLTDDHTYVTEKGIAYLRIIR